MVHTQLQSSLCVCVCMRMYVCVNEPSLYMTSKLWVLDITWFNFEPKPNILVINFWLGIPLECVFHVHLFLVNISLCFPHMSSTSFWVCCIYSVVCIFFLTLSLVCNMKCLTRGWFSCYHQAHPLSMKCSSLFCPNDRQFVEGNKKTTL